jgi:uncharacterized membrane protein (UPF0127 family)
MPSSHRRSNKRKQIIETVVIVCVLAFVVMKRFHWFPGPSTASGWSPAYAQPKLPTTKLWLGSQELVAELAQTSSQIASGLMFRTNLGPNEAMLFVFATPWRASFYMKNTLIPLSCAYIDSKGVILETHDMKPLDETTIYAASTNIQFVLEVRQGWFKTNQIGEGTLVRTENGPLQSLLH